MLHKSLLTCKLQHGGSIFVSVLLPSIFSIVIGLGSMCICSSYLPCSPVSAPAPVLQCVEARLGIVLCVLGSCGWLLYNCMSLDVCIQCIHMHKLCVCVLCHANLFRQSCCLMVTFAGHVQDIRCKAV